MVSLRLTMSAASAIGWSERPGSLRPWSRSGQPGSRDSHGGNVQSIRWTRWTEAARQVGFDRFNVVGYSAGGAVAVALAAEHPWRVRSLALLEPAWAGEHGMSPEESDAHERVRAALKIEDPDTAMQAFVQAQLSPSVPRPASPPGPRPAWMAKRPAGARALMRAFDEAELGFEALSAFEGPVWFAVGGLSNHDLYARKAERLAVVWPRMTIRVFPERHRLDPPHRAEAGQVAAALSDLWAS